MIENLILVAIFGGLIAVTFVVIRYIVKQKQLQAEARERQLQAEAEAARQRAQLRRDADAARKSLSQAHLEETFSVPRKKRTFVKREETAMPPRGKETSVSYASSPTQSVQSYQDNFMSDIATAMVINTLLASGHDSQSGVVTENRDTGRVDIKVKESSWGFDDSDSRKSISSSMDTSSSYSSDSSSSSSSYDSGSSSGPSSDW